MVLAAWNEGVSCPNGIANPDSLAELPGLEADEQVKIVVSFGYPAGAGPGSAPTRGGFRPADRRPARGGPRHLALVPATRCAVQGAQARAGLELWASHAGTRLVVEQDRSRPARGPLEPRRGRGLPAPPRRGLGAVPGQPLPDRARSGGRRAPPGRHDRPRDRDRSLRPLRSGRARAGRPSAWPRHPRLLLLPRPASRRRRRGGCHPGVSAGRGRSGALPRAGPA